jgi:preprotein translocase subunit SecF
MSSKKKELHEERVKKQKFKEKNKLRIIIPVILVMLVVVLFIGYRIKKTLEPAGHKVTTVSKASLEKVLDISELSTLDYNYNAIATVYEDDNTTVKYYVAYEGTVNAGIDFSKIEVSEPDEEKHITITLPEIEIQNTNVDMGSLDYIFIKSKYNKETVSQEAYLASQNDLESRANDTVELEQMAKDNAVASVQALIQPWLDQLDEGYTVDIQ